MYSTKWQCIYRCTVTRGFRLINIQSTRGKVLTATAALISLPERCQSVNRQQSLIFFWRGPLSGAKMVMMVRHVNGGETCEQCFSTDKQYDTCFQKSSYLPWRLKFGHLGVNGYQIYFSVYRVGQNPSKSQPLLAIAMRIKPRQSLDPGTEHFFFKFSKWRALDLFTQCRQSQN